MPISTGRKGTPGVLALPGRRFLSGQPFRSRPLSTTTTIFLAETAVEIDTAPQPGRYALTALETDTAYTPQNPGAGFVVETAVETDTAGEATRRIAETAVETDTAFQGIAYSVGGWPFDDLKPRHIGIYPCAATIGGGTALTRKEPAIDSGAGYWRIEYGGIPINSRARILLWRKLEVMLEGRAREISLPIYDGKRAPWLGAPGGAITATANAAAAIGATSMSINATSSGALKVGQFFSPAGRLHRITRINSTVGSVYGVNIWPKLRDAIGSGDALDFRRPTCRCRLANDDGMALNLELLRSGDASVTFEEAL